MKKHVVVFDLDETLGFFSSFGVFCCCLNYVFQNNNYYQENFNTLLDLYPEILRPNLYKILNYLKNKKKLEACNKVIIYTNNQGPKEWTMQIKDYFNSKIKYNLFDSIIAAFKVDGKKIELCRTSHGKNIGDFLSCTNLPKNTQVFFLDDQYHMGMENKNVYYINIFPYVYHIPWNEMINRYLNKFQIESLTKEQFENKMMVCINKYNINNNTKNKIEFEAEHVISLKLITHLKEFFINVPNKSIKKKNNNKKTKKKKIIQ